MNNSFDDLLNRYLEDKASEEDVAALMALLNTGQHDALVKQRITAMLAEPADEDLRTARAERMLQAIVSTKRNTDTPVVQLRTQTTRWWWAAAAIIILALAGGIALLLRPTDRMAPETIAQQEPEPTIYSGKQYVRLPDGSTVLLNENSELRYEHTFARDTREVFLTGEAYFDIKHDAGKAFRVHTGKVVTTVLGTAFNIKAWPEAGEVKVNVDRGKVQVGDATQTYGTITRDQQIAVNTVTFAYEQTDVKVQEATEWKSSYLIFEDMSLNDAIAVIEANYHVRVEVDNEKLKDCRVSATFLNGEDLDQVMTVLTAVIQATYTQTNTTIVIHGPGCV